jgi:arsenite-transporting ATPase
LPKGSRGALGRHLSSAPRRIAVRGGTLLAAEIDARRALGRWLAPRHAALAAILLRGTLLDRDDVERLLDLTVPGVDELVALIEIETVAQAVAPDLVVVDTAPTGHTRRLLESPDAIARIAGVLDVMLARHRAVAEALTGRPRRDAADALVKELTVQAARLTARLADARQTTISWVTTAEPVAIAEAVDALEWLLRRHLPVREVVVNRLTPPPARPCACCDARRALERDALAPLTRKIAAWGRASAWPLRFIPDITPEPRGVPALTRLARSNARLARARRGARSVFVAPVDGPEAASLVLPSSLKLVVVGGKGGVGKTTVAAALALGAADRRVLLLSADPAHSMGDVLDVPLGDDPRPVPGAGGRLDAREIDAAAALDRERRRLAAAVDRAFDAGARGGVTVDLSHDREVARRLLDLSPPGLDEIVALLSAIEAIVPDSAQSASSAYPASSAACPAASSAAYDLVIIDTAPTGHALRFLAMPDVARQWTAELLRLLLKYQAVAPMADLGGPLVALSRGVRRLRALLTDSRRSRFLAVTRAAALPRAETIRLMDAVADLGLAAPAVVVNAVGAGECARCRRLRAAERNEIGALRRQCDRAGRCDIILAPLELPPPRGVERLVEWARRWQHR